MSCYAWASTVHIAHEGDVLFTRGLAKYMDFEVRLTLGTEDRGPDGHALVDHVTSYVVQTGRVIEPGETYQYGFWMLKFFASSGNLLDIGEVVPGTHDEFQQNASCAMRYWREQTMVCDRVRALHRPPSAGMVGGISPGLYEGGGAEGSRYRLGDDKSGWVLVGDGWQGEPEDLQFEHLYHLTIYRPELVRYLGLPHGYRFHVSADGVETDLEFDPEIA